MADEYKVTNDGEIKFFKDGMKTAKKIALFTNDVIVADDHDLTDFTQPTYTGYAPQDLDAWPDPTTDGNGAANSTHANVSFDYTALSPAVTIKGAVVYDPANDEVLAVVKYEFEETLSGNGSHIIGASLQLESAD